MRKLQWGSFGILFVITLATGTIELLADPNSRWQQQEPFSFSADENCMWYEEEPLISFRTLMRDFACFGRNLFSGDSVAVLAPFVPVWGASYAIDDRVHHHFYCGKHHVNIRQCSTKLIDLSECLVGMSIGTLCACSFAVGDRRLQRTGLLYALTLPLTWAAKSLVKKFHWCGNHRPGHAGFPKKTNYGGFPSGHMLEMTYATVLFGLSIGPQFAIPLGLSTAIIAATFVQTNRHYVSQLIAGAAIGAWFGCAAYWSVTREEKGASVQISCVPDTEHQQIAFRAVCEF